MALEEGGGSTGVNRPRKDDNEEEKLSYELGGDNLDFFQEEEFDPAAWIGSLGSILRTELRASAESIGETPQWADMILSTNWSKLLQSIDFELIQGKPTTSLGRAAAARVPSGSGRLGAMDAANPPRMEYYLQGEGWNKLVDYARSYLQMRTPSLRDNWERLASGRGGGGGGTRLPTEAEIRQNFDLDQLAAEAQNIWRSFLLEEHPDARGLGRAYVDAVVASQGQQKIDFKSFVEKRVDATARAAAIYSNKPKSMSKEQFLMPYFTAAQQMVGGTDEAADLAIGGAQFGASGSAFQSRLNRTDANTGSAPFITELEGRMRDIRKVFKQ